MSASFPLTMFQLSYSILADVLPLQRAVRRGSRPGCDLADRATRKAVTGWHVDKCVGDSKGTKIADF
jgi:hypothetical protein